MHKFVLFALVFSLVACGGNVSIDSTGTPDPGVSGAAGSSDVPPGTGGSGAGGQAGATGMGGSPSAGGASGEAGQGNQAGAAGQAGMAGAAGMAGQPGTGGSAGIGAAGQAGAAGAPSCTPTVTFTTTSHQDGEVAVGSAGVTVLKGTLSADDCSDVEISRLTFIFTSPDFDNTDPASQSGYCKAPCSAPSDWNFQNLTVESQDNGSTLMGPLASPKQGASNQPAVLDFKDAFTLKAGETKHIAVGMMVPSPLATDVAGKRFEANFIGLNTASYSVLVSNDTSADPNATFTVVSALYPLTVQPSTNMPSPQIVIGGKDVRVPFSTWDITNGSSGDIVVTSANIRQVDPNGDNADFTMVGLSVNGTSVMSGVATDPNDGNWSVDGLSPLTIPAHGTVEVTVWGKMANVVSSSSANGAWNGVARSGHSPSLAIASVRVKETNAFLDVPVASATLPSMVLRKSQPYVTKLPLVSSTLIEGADQDLFTFQVTPDLSGSIELAQFGIAWTKSVGMSLYSIGLRRGSTELTFSGSAKIVSDPDRGGNPVLPQETNGVLMFDLGDMPISSSGDVFTVHGTFTGTVPGSSVTLGFDRVPVDTIPVTAFLENPASGPETHLCTVNGCYPTPGMDAYMGSFLWSDLTEVPHSWSSTDWTNDLYVQDMGQTQTLMR